jgi:hypothetical protein
MHTDWKSVRTGFLTTLAIAAILSGGGVAWPSSTIAQPAFEE